jgi:hypothetical protein
MKLNIVTEVPYLVYTLDPDRNIIGKLKKASSGVRMGPALFGALIDDCSGRVSHVPDECQDAINK